MTTKRASIDIGSNSTLLLIIDVDTKEVIEEQSRITSLGKDLDENGEFLENSMIKTYEALRDYVKTCESHNIKPSEVIMTGTEASRVASNAKSFFKRVQENLHLKINLISGEGEAYYTALGVSQMADLEDEEVVIMDVGGASTELILLKTKPFQIISSVSIPVGSVRSTDWLEMGSFNKELAKAFKDVDFNHYTNRKVICVAGTLTSLAAMISGSFEFNAETINSYSSSVDNLKNYVSRISSKTTEELLEEYSYLGKRASSIVGGGECSIAVLEKIQPLQLLFSTYGLRYGTAIQGSLDGNFVI